MGLFGSIAGIFGASSQVSAANEAKQILQQAQSKAYDYSSNLQTQFAPFLSDYQSKIGTSFDLIQQLTNQADAAGTAGGLTAADQISYQDAARLMNSNMAATGNLRSGASAFANEQLAQRAIADAANRRLSYMQLAFQGAGTLANTASSVGQFALGGQELAANVFNTGTNLAGSIAQAQVGIGAAKANKAQAIGSVFDSVVNTGAGFVMGAPGMEAGPMSSFVGASMGGNNLMQYKMLQNMFQGVGSSTSGSSNLNNYYNG